MNYDKKKQTVATIYKWASPLWFLLLITSLAVSGLRWLYIPSCACFVAYAASTIYLMRACWKESRSLKPVLLNYAFDLLQILFMTTIICLNILDHR